MHNKINNQKYYLFLNLYYELHSTFQFEFIVSNILEKLIMSEIEETKIKTDKLIF